MSDINNRFSKIVRASGLSKTAFGERINISQQYVSKLTKFGVPSDRTISDICREFNVSETWLRTGEGEMFNQLDDDADFLNICEQINIHDDLIKRVIKAYWSLDENEKAAIRKLIDRFLQDDKAPE